MLHTHEEHELLPLVTGPFIAAQMSEELVWELFVQGGPIGETRIISMVSILYCTASRFWPWEHAEDVNHRSERVPAQGPGHQSAPGLRLRGVSHRGRRRLCANPLFICHALHRPVRTCTCKLYPLSDAVRISGMRTWLGQYDVLGHVCLQAVKVLNMIKVYGKPIRVNKASQDKRSQDMGANLFIGNLDPEVDEKVHR